MGLVDFIFFKNKPFQYEMLSYCPVCGTKTSHKITIINESEWSEKCMKCGRAVKERVY